METELVCRYDSRKSFYGKARVVSMPDRIALISYNTKVAEIKDNKAVVFGTYSMTTLRHIKEFLLQNGFKADSSAQILKDYSPTKEDKTKTEDCSFLKSVSIIASLGDMFCDKQKDSNDWKARMLKAGLTNKGLIMPDDWDSLSEDEKEKRLNCVISEGVKN